MGRVDRGREGWGEVGGWQTGRQRRGEGQTKGGGGGTEKGTDIQNDKQTENICVLSFSMKGYNSHYTHDGGYTFL